MSGAEAGLVLGLISSIITIIQSTCQVYEAVDDAKGLPTNFKKSAAKLPLISKLLEDAEKYVENIADEAIQADFRPALDNCKLQATRLHELFAKVMPEKDDSRLDRYVKAARTIGKGGRIEELVKGILDDLQLIATKFPEVTTPRSKEQLAKAVDDVAKLEPSLPDGFEDMPVFAHYGSGAQNNNMAGGTQNNNNSTGNQNTGTGAQYNGTTYVDQSQTFNSIPKTEQQQLLESCQKSLDFERRNDRPMSIANETKDTCRWLLQHQNWKDWKSHGGMLLLKGIPGSGKSTLLQYAIKNTQETTKSLVLSFFFFGSGDILQRTALGLYRSLLHQALKFYEAQTLPSSLKDLVGTFESRRNTQRKEVRDWEWEEDELRNVCIKWLEETSKRSQIFLFVDALDECQEDAKDHVIKLLNGFYKASCHPEVKICFALRDDPKLVLTLTHTHNFEIRMESENSKDISVYVERNLTRFEGLPLIIADITNRAGGRFIWAVLVVEKVESKIREMLEGSHTSREIVSEIQDLVQSYPNDLNKFYCQFVKSMRNKPASLVLIRWIYCAERPLSVDELRWAMVVDSDHSYKSLRECKDSSHYEEKNEYMKSKIQMLSRGLVRVVPSSSTMTVQFIHQTVKDFFKEEGLTSLYKEVAALNGNLAIGTAHGQLSKACVRYLAMKEFGQSKDYPCQKFPFLAYATTSWVDHAKQCDMEGVAQDDLLELLFWPSNGFVERWTQVYQAIDKYSSRCPVEKTNLVHIMARYGFSGLLTAILEKSGQAPEYIDSKDKTGRTPLSWAVGEGHKETVSKLIEHADINTQENSGARPLARAIDNGSKDIIEMLLQKNAEVNFIYRSNEQLSEIWIDFDFFGLFIVLVAALGDFGLFDDDFIGVAALLALVVAGGVAFEGVAAAARRAYLRTPLLRAVEIRNKHVVGLLLDHGARPTFDRELPCTPHTLANSHSRKYRNDQEWEEILQLLKSYPRSL